MRRPTLALLLACVVVVAACGDDGGGGSTTTSAPPPTTTSTVPTTTSPAATAPVQVFFVRDAAVATAGRTVTPPAVARGALEALLDGPDATEEGLGMSSAIAPGTTLEDVAVAGGTATVELSAPVDDLGLAQVVFTLTQFPTVERVSIDGATVDRGDVEAQTPFILVQSPTPGATVEAPFEVSGIANTFEANVQYEVVSADGTVLDDGFTTATAGTGTWGDFSFTTDVPAGEAVVRVFEESAEDGSRINVYEVPVTVA